MVVVSLLITLLGTTTLLIIAYLLNPYLYLLVATILTYQIFALNSLKKASELIYDKLDNLDEARQAVGMIVGRQTANLDEEEVVNACVESVVENTSDGITAPLFYLFLGGPILGMLYKDINTMDSMIGYRNEHYKRFGYTAAKVDDLFNLIPARLTSWLMIVASFFLCYDYRNAFKIYWRDSNNHLSPNAGHLEAASAGALNIQLGGCHTYFNETVEKPMIGDKKQKSAKKHIKQANNLMVFSSFLSLIIYDAIYLFFLI